ncbi:MAG: GNAT family N-acetyltransferase [Bacteroidota bacterium]
MNISYCQATEKDTEALRSLLESHKLPTETVGMAATDFYIASDNNVLAGVAGFEYYGEDALLRSVAVPASLQNKQIGSQLVDWMLLLAKQKNMRRIVLLTETASKFFAGKGFVIIDRSSLRNEAMKKSSQFCGGCCSSALCMKLDL